MRRLPLGECAVRAAGFTLLETLLALAVLLILAGFAWPVLDRMLTTYRLSRAADRVRARWTTARTDAITSGRTLLFQYEPGGVRYRIECLEDDADEGETVPLCIARLPLEQTLPEGVQFAPDESATAFGQQSLEGDEPALAEAGWSTPILFYPDGTCTNARLILENRHQWTAEVQLRGVTGVVTVGRARSPQETPVLAEE